MNDIQVIPLGLAPSFGFGDRTGLATPGHVEALCRAGGAILPIFPQQSIREMARTRRSPELVMADALQGAKQAGYAGPTGADADHLKTPEDVDATVAAGYTFFTIDPSEYVVGEADRYDESSLRAEWRGIRDEIAWLDDYRGSIVTLPNGTQLDISEEACLRCAVKYGRAIRHAIEMAAYIQRRNEEAGRDHEIELSVDETNHPTTLAEHYIIADQCRKAGMKLVSLAPRYIGEFEKGVDYKGDMGALERSLADHAAIAEILGPYKLSLHSGSDKLSIYPALAQATKGRFHVKTAGTSYLEALRVAARRDESLFRRIVEFARERYTADKATYHVSATLDSAPPAGEVEDTEMLEKLYLGLWHDVPEGQGFTEPGRQILHCTFGSVLTHPELSPALRAVLEEYADDYTEILADHFARQLTALNAGI